MNQAGVQTDLARWQDELEAAMQHADREPMIVRVYQETRSTQDIAKTFAPKPALIVADQQTAGRGRLGRTWLSAPGLAVLMSLVYPNPSDHPTHDRLSMLAGVAVAQAVRCLVPDAPVRLKWPNDIMIDGKKLAGILIESVSGAGIIGVGLNVLADQEMDMKLREIATSLQAYGRAMDRLLVIQTITDHLLRTLGTNTVAEGLASWRSLASTGQTQTFEQAGQRITGQVLDLDRDHGLIVRRDSGEIITLPAATTSVVQ